MTQNVRRLPQVPSLSWDDCHLLVESVVDYAIFMLDQEGHVATWNSGAERIKGYLPEEIVGRHFSAFYTPEDLASGKPARALAAATAEGRFEDEAWRLRKDGTRFWASVIITALRDPGGRLRGFGKVTRDLTRRRLEEEKLRLSEERFRLLVDGVTDYAIYILDPDGRVATWNAGAERLKGYTAAEILGEPLARFFPPEDVLAGKPEAELRMAREQGRFEEEGWRIRKNGTRFWANVIVTRLRDERGNFVGYAKVTRDLTARRDADETRKVLAREQIARTAAEEANRAKDEFLAVVSHELRTPLNAILGWATLLQQQAPGGAVAKGLEVIDRNARGQARLIDDILDVSAIVSGKLRLDRRPMPIGEAIRDAVDAMRPVAAAKDVTLELLVAGELPVVLADGGRLRQILNNLLTNAVKFTDAGGSITVTATREADRVAIAVRDTGRGIDPAFLPFVFDRFRQGDSSTTRGFGGLGLGLAIVKHLVLLHGGRVQAESEGSGRGAVFRFTIPIGVDQPPPASDGAHAGPRPAPLLDVRILVLEDDADARDLLCDLLTGAGATVEVFERAAGAFAQLPDFRPDLVISDIGMPDEDGYSFMRRVRALGAERGGDVPALALTAYTRTDDRAAAMAAGFTGHLAKPIDPDVLVDAILRALARR
jgi:PAS domain S-box-containing protein